MVISKLLYGKISTSNLAPLRRKHRCRSRGWAEGNRTQLRSTRCSSNKGFLLSDVLFFTVLGIFLMSQENKQVQKSDCGGEGGGDHVWHVPLTWERALPKAVHN